MVTETSQHLTFYFFLGLLLFCFNHRFNRVSADTLELVQIVYRHGDRSPTDPLPNDPNNEYWLTVTDGYGQLTNTGKQQHYELGQYIRQRYSSFLNASYGHEEITISSTDKDRTLMSAYSNLAGLYPPTGNQVWDSGIPWQPIPVHTRPLVQDYIVGDDGFCPKFDALFEMEKQSPEMQELNAENADLFALASNETGEKINDIFSLNKITDYFFCCKCHDLVTPQWIEPVWDQMLHLHDLKFYYEYGIPPLARLIGGPLVGDMIDHMQQKANGETPSQKAYVYSSHDSKLAAFLAAMQVFNMLAPPYFSTVFVELYSLDAGGHGVQIWYRNDTSVDPYPLTLPNCTTTCPLDQFVQLTSAEVPTDVQSECLLASANNNNNTGNNKNLPSPKVWSWVEKFWNYYNYHTLSN